MRKRLPNLLFCFGLLGVVLYPRLAQHLAPAMRTDFALGLAIGVSLAVELLGAMLLIRSRNRSSCRT